MLFFLGGGVKGQRISEWIVFFFFFGFFFFVYVCFFFFFLFFFFFFFLFFLLFFFIFVFFCGGVKRATAFFVYCFFFFFWFVFSCSCLFLLSSPFSFFFSFQNLRTALLDGGVGAPLCDMLVESDVQLQNAATAALCNIVMEFSPLKKVRGI